MNSASYVSNTYTGQIKQLTDDPLWASSDASIFTSTNRQQLYGRLSDNGFTPVEAATNHKEKNDMAKSARRYVQIFIIDPDSRVPLDKSALYEGNPFLTDLTDQELFYELEIKSILADYNSYRITVQDKKASDKFGRDVLLEAVKIRDLSMTVVEIAAF